MDKLAEFYEGFWGDEYEDALKDLYWSLRALDAGNPNGASNIARLYTYNAEFKRDSVFAYAWDARFCIGAGKKNWPVESYPSYEKLQKAGYSRTDWEGLAELTYLPVPQVSAENQDSINDVAIFAIDLLKVRAEDFRIAYNVHKRNVSSISMASAEKGSFTSSTIPSATYEETRNAASRRKRNWLSAIGRALDVVNTAVNGGNVWTAAAQGMSIASGGQVPGNGVNASMLEVFKYNGEQRKGMKDFNGRVIRNELTAPCVYGQAHYTWYEDGFCFVCSVSTCVGCYGRKICTVCSGRGQIYHAYFKNYVQCGACLGAGRCKYCQGAGCKVTTKLWAPGEAEAYQAAKREEVGDYSLGGGSSSNSHSGVCPKCGGKGYRAEAYTYAAGSSVAPYHNSGGTSCYICGKATDHYHYRCTECKRH